MNNYIGLIIIILMLVVLGCETQSSKVSVASSDTGEKFKDTIVLAAKFENEVKNRKGLQFPRIREGTDKLAVINQFGRDPDYVSDSGRVIGWSRKRTNFETISFRIKFDEEWKSLGVLSGSTMLVFYEIPPEENIIGQWVGKDSFGGDASYTFYRNGSVSINLSRKIFRRGEYQWSIIGNEFPLQMSIKSKGGEATTISIVRFYEKDCMTILMPSGSERMLRSYTSGYKLHLHKIDAAEP